MDENVEKIVVRTDDELIDVVKKISNTDIKKMLVSFVEDSEILISSINLKVLLDSADEKEALLILQIVNNPTGVRNAKLAGACVIESSGLPSEEAWEEARREYKNRIEERKRTKIVLPQEYKSENITSFEERVNSVLTKNREERDSLQNLKGEGREHGGIVIDQDIESKEVSSSAPNQEDFTKVDFKSVPGAHKPSGKEIPLFSSIAGFFKNLGKKKGGIGLDTQKKIVKLLPKILIPLVIVFFLVAFIYYKFAPYIRATIFIESKPVEIEKIFAGNENINEIDFEKNEIPIKTESVTKSASDSAKATGTAFKGDKATGSVTITYIVSGGCTDANEPINLTEGQQIVSEIGGKNFTLTGNVTVTCNNYGNVGVEATEVGEEYNLSAGNRFIVTGYGKDVVYGLNSSPFVGGSKKEYTIISKQDVDSKVKELTEIAAQEAESSLKDIGSGWKIIESTIKSKVKEGSVKSSAPIGTEAASSDISLEVESSATYYYTEGVDKGLNALLTEAAINQNLFESSEGLVLALKGDIKKDLEVSEKGGTVNITLTASSSVQPSVEKEDLIKDLKGMKWEEGNEYLKSLSFTADRDPVVVFTPESFPKKLRHFPTKQGRINIKIEEVKRESE
ncbi:MAG: hypothetical protein WCR68_00165 [Candidatus Dojkabacteria bacterium]|jgi:hypothetical protein|nr:baseplate J/gp47 family protein [Candidatus Dojkabacteria bacterium]